MGEQDVLKMQQRKDFYLQRFYGDSVWQSFLGLQRHAFQPWRKDQFALLLFLGDCGSCVD